MPRGHLAGGAHALFTVSAKDLTRRSVLGREGLALKGVARGALSAQFAISAQSACKQRRVLHPTNGPRTTHHAYRAIAPYSSASLGCLLDPFTPSSSPTAAKSPSGSSVPAARRDCGPWPSILRPTRMLCTCVWPTR